MTLSNKITLSRIILGPIAFWGIVREKIYVAIAIIILNLFLDGLDGFLARNRGEKTKLGEIIDPLVDFLFFSFLSLALYLTGAKEVKWALILFALIILGFVFSFFNRGKKFQILHSKTKYLHTPLLYLSVVFIILKVSFWRPFFAITITILSISYFELLLRSLKGFLFKKQPQ